MKKIKNIFKRSLSTRLSLWVVFFAAIIFTAVFSLMFTETREVIREEAWGKATQTLDGTVMHIDNTLHQVEVASDNMLRVIEQNLDKPDNMFDYSRQVLESNPNLTGCSISFEPYYFKDKGRYFSAYSYNDGDSIQTEQEGTDNYQYHCMDWYLIPKLLDRPYWIEPFQEDAIEGIIVKEIFSSYSRPIHDKEGKVVGTFSLDICLDWFAQTISEAKPYPHAYSVMLGRGGTYLVHPDTTKLFYETVFTQTLERPDSVITLLGESMIAGESGHKTVTFNGEVCHVFYRPFKNTGWSVAIVCPESDIFEGYNQLKSGVQMISLIGLLILLAVCWIVVKNRLHPLRQLARTTQLISNGEFSNVIPESHRSDEIGQLQRTFQSMQRSLRNNIQEVRQQTETLEQQNAELQEAYERTKEEERVKSKVLHKMSNKMSDPVSYITILARSICERRHEMSDEEVNKMVDNILSSTKQVTQLLDKMII